MKKSVLGGMVLLVLAGATAGVFYGPAVYRRFFPAHTPLGTITRLEPVEQFPPEGGAGAVQPIGGYRLWVVHFAAPAAGPPPAPMREWVNRVVVIDETGQPHGPAISEERYAGEQVTERLLVFPLPRERTPRSIRFGQASALLLPAPAGK